jgi:hypothetical protein
MDVSRDSGVEFVDLETGLNVNDVRDKAVGEAGTDEVLH